MNRKKTSLLICILLCSSMSLWSTSCKVTQEKAAECDTLDIYLLIGQSNMAGRGQVTDTTSVPGIYSFNKEKHWTPARDPLHFDKREAGVGPGLSFAREIKKHNPQRNIGLVPCAVGGTSISKWKPGAYDQATKTHPYDDAIARVKCALKSGKLKGVLWHQGEGDYNKDKYKRYEARFDSLLTNLSRDLQIDIQTLPIVVGELGRFNLAKKPANQCAEMNVVLHQMADKHPNMRCVSSDGLTHRGDVLHFDTPSAQELGRRYAEAYLILCNKH